MNIPTWKWWASGPDEAIVGVALREACGPTRATRTQIELRAAAHETIGRRSVDWTSVHTDRAFETSSDTVQKDPEGPDVWTFYNFM